MTAQRVNRISGRVVTALSVVAFLTVLTGYTQRPLPDEGALAHIFQLTIVALAPVILLFLGTVDWKRSWQEIGALAFPAAMIVAAFAALYYLEHYWYR